MYKKLVEFRPSISSENMGDHIIQLYIDTLMDEMFGERMTVTMPTRSHLTDRNYAHIKSADYSFICGTNLLASNMNKRKQWDLKVGDAFRLRNLILLGVGWWQYQDNPNLCTKALLKRILHPGMLHSVRDGYTEKKLKSIGIDNVINTACPTMWGLTPDKMQHIPQKKADSVVTTLTNYMKSEELDKFMLDCLISNYRKVYVWLQAIEDYSQLDKLGFLNKVQIIPPSIKEYEKVLSLDVDYIGTRLHGGIHALNYGKRTLIISVDNRAIEIKKDTNLPVISRESVKEELDEMINEPRITEIHLPQNNINIWKQQFAVCGGGTAL